MVRNNSVGTVMRLACGLAIALWLSFPAAGLAQQPDTAGGATLPPGQAPASAPSTSAAKKHSKHKLPARSPDGAPRKIVVHEGGAREPTAQISPGLTSAETARERQNAERWLDSAGDQLKQITGRTLAAQQQETMGQIHNYMDGARAALHEGDVRRASTLAEKAHLLAEDLVKR
jgi:hypothetical protein